MTNNKFECERMKCEKLENDEFKGCDAPIDFSSECSVTCAKDSYHMMNLEEDDDTVIESTKYKCECTASSCALEPQKEVQCVPKPCPKIPDNTVYKSQASGALA